MLLTGITITFRFLPRFPIFLTIGIIPLLLFIKINKNRDQVFLVIAIKKNTKMLSPVEGIIISVTGLSNKSKCSIFSYIKNAKNRMKAITAYCNLWRPVFRYAEIDSPIKTADRTDPAMYKNISIQS